MEQTLSNKPARVNFNQEFLQTINRITIYRIFSISFLTNGLSTTLSYWPLYKQTDVQGNKLNLLYTSRGSDQYLQNHAFDSEHKRIRFLKYIGEGRHSLICKTDVCRWAGDVFQGVESLQFPRGGGGGGYTHK